MAALDLEAHQLIRRRTSSVSGRLRDEDIIEIGRIIPDAEGVFKGQYIGSLPAKLPKDPDAQADVIFELLLSMKAFQASVKVFFLLCLCVTLLLYILLDK